MKVIPCSTDIHGQAHFLASPAGSIDVQGERCGGGRGHLGHRVGGGRIGAAFGLADHAGGDRQAHRIGQECLHRASAQALATRQQGDGGQQPGAESSSEDIRRERAVGGFFAGQADQMMETVLDDVGLDLGESRDLMRMCGGVFASQTGASEAFFRNTVDDLGQLFGRSHWPNGSLVPRVAAAFAFEGGPKWLAIGLRRVRRWRFERVGRVEIGSSLERGDLGLQRSDLQTHRLGERLGRSRQGVPNIAKKWKRGRHAPDEPDQSPRRKPLPP